jgi:hypothetical protein
MPITTTQLSKINLSDYLPLPFAGEGRGEGRLLQKATITTNRQTALSEQRPNLLLQFRPTTTESISIAGGP